MDNNFYSCHRLEKFNLHLLAMKMEKPVCLCCEPLENLPGVSLDGASEDVFKHLKDIRDNILSEGYLDLDDPKRKYTNTCKKCIFYKKDIWKAERAIQELTFGLYPSPCQSKCFYCSVWEDCLKGDQPEAVSDYYDKMLNFVEYIKDNDFIDKNARWNIASGEITIHPYRERLLNAVGNSKCRFFTNMFKYDERIAANLSANSKSTVFLSIDAGTKETWRKIKGVDNFERVLENLFKYRDISEPGQIMLKYIIFPGINDDDENFEAVAKIMSLLNSSGNCISRDTREKYDIDSEKMNIIMDSYARLVSVFEKYDLAYDLWDLSPEQKLQVVANARKL